MADERINILLVDDQPAKLLSYQVILAELGENLIQAGSGSEALMHLLKRDIAVVLVDVCMPGLDGFELAQMIREHPRLRRTAIILVSGVFMTDLDRLKGYHSGAVDYVHVPIIPEVLRAKVRVFADLYRKTEELRLLNAELERRVDQRTADLEASAARLAESERRFQLAIGASPMTVYTHDLDLKYTWIFNPPAGYDHQQMLGRRDDELLPAEDVRELMALKQRVVASGHGERAQIEVRMAGGERVLDVVAEPMRDADQQIVGLTVAASDITPIRATEQALRKSEELFRFLAESIPSMVWTAGPDGRITYANSRWLEYCGTTLEQNGGQWPDLTPHPDDRQRWLDEWARSAREGKAFQIEMRYRRHDGVYRWFLTRAAPRTGTEGQVGSWFGVTTDIHDQKEMQEQLREADRRKDEFLAMLAHELRNPLSPIRNAIQIMRQAHMEDRTLIWCRDVIERQTEHLTRLVDDLLDISRITRGKVKLKKAPIELSAVIGRALEITRPLIDARLHQLTVTTPDEPLLVDGDMTRLAQVVGNLLNNAAKYTDEQGRISLSVEVARPGQAHPEEAVIRVKDTGMGIPPAMLPRVFDLFTQVELTTEHSQGGLGIGLSLVRTLVDLHGGTVTAHSDGIGRGSEFVVRLPLLPRRPQVAVAPPAETAAPPRSLLIVIADDNPDSALTLAMLLRCLKHRVHTAADGMEALAAAERLRPEVMLLDIGMPRLDGYETARRIRALDWGKDVLLIAQTGWGQESDRRRAAEAGFDFHLTKPIEHAALLKILAARAARPAPGADAGGTPTANEHEGTTPARP